MIHKNLTLDRWCKFSLLEQLANVGTDVERALELLDLTIADPKHRGKGSLKELTRTGEMLIDYFVYDNEYGSTDEFWQEYFFAFNYSAALQRGR